MSSTHSFSFQFLVLLSTSSNLDTSKHWTEIQSYVYVLYSVSWLNFFCAPTEQQKKLVLYGLSASAVFSICVATRKTRVITPFGLCEQRIRLWSHRFAGSYSTFLVCTYAYLFLRRIETNKTHTFCAPSKSHQIWTVVICSFAKRDIYSVSPNKFGWFVNTVTSWNNSQVSSNRVN